METPETKKGVGIFIDFEYLHISLERLYGFVLDADVVVDGIRVKVKPLGKIILEKAYASWSNFIKGLTELSKKRVETVNITSKKLEKTDLATGKRCTITQNNADIYIAWDVAQIIYTNESIDTFVLVSGDGDFVEIVRRVQQAGRKVVVLGFEANTSDLLRGQADTFIAIDDLARASEDIITNRIIDLSLDLELKLDYIGFKLIVDILEREDQTTRFRDYIQNAIKDEVFVSEHREVEGSVKGEVFALQLNHAHPMVEERIKQRVTEGKQVKGDSSTIPDNGSVPNVPMSENHEDPSYLTAVQEIEAGNYKGGYAAIKEYLSRYPEDFAAYLWDIQCLINLNEQEELTRVCNFVYRIPGYAMFAGRYPDWARYIETKIDSETEVLSGQEL